ncbi:HlyD family efflux transporter periplasmic adaptor subunit [Synechococcus sp. Cruz-9H2]|uniref:HlyD family efflux transporter periplasmic adaptor subunit n=1 Tax=unclassified Synechococcus TaxID=2626047 RepID=UPI0020CBA14C|nr:MULTISPECIES: HlyD family efflux transporter periplasmic adaptor subunit [unclassified Synechococcus]MCP9817934.1 HlyD family efflux transporter periplasmic adaptor subunit [Synechococcus sp. Cruz-9H2]MCP9842566.1 HlyD family efflux transporter periplasmic adaptor subunit [Synechococcus sp. Edmonson 11F2]MCP9854330.1 HlyD family efflux transporter periplasmic adaptor subunit [Synechococcus sp. Cruz-9C9]MCP9861974.1 HlyD family efflux transporter periplasmic adaptor subunit [Synechococcus sp.
MSGLPLRTVLIGAAALLVVAGTITLISRSQQGAKPEAEPQTVAQPRTLEAVSALGRLEPAGDIRKLAAPITGIGGSPRITELLVEEGQRVQAGQLLATFDTGPALQAQRRLLQSRIANLTDQVTLLGREISRYRQLAKAGATPAADLESRELTLVELKGNLREAQDELVKTEADLVNTELRAPFSGTVLKLISRVGERPGDDGILELGASDQMEVLAEVYESDINRLRLGQRASVTSENGGFSGTLNGRVIRISPQVRQRDVLSTDPTGDADARIVEVRLALDPADIPRISTRAGLKTVIRFEP